ncbi:MAG: AI-2E family transporter [Thermoanaerobaculia bacterium]|nr:AI-2E family transporter [Thermoanaerobaculia bacterium]
MSPRPLRSSESGDRRASGRWSTPTVALRGLFVLALVASLKAAQTLVFPLVLALLLSLLLRPPVRWLERLKLPSAVGALVVLLIGLAGLALAFDRFQEPAMEWIGRAPRTIERLERRVRDLRRPVEEVSAAAEEVQKMASGDDGRSAEVEIRKPSPAEMLVSKAPELVGGVVVTMVFLYLLLVFGPALSHRVIESFPRFRDRQRAETIFEGIGGKVSRYLLTITFINTCLGLVLGLVFQLLGLPSPWLWGAMAGLLNFVPYLGGFVGVFVVTLVSISTFGDPGKALLAPVLYAMINATEGLVITPIVLGNRFSLNPVVIFGWLLLWGWLWGVGGLLIAIPLLTIFKIFCEQIPPLHWISRALER